VGDRPRGRRGGGRWQEARDWSADVIPVAVDEEMKSTRPNRGESAPRLPPLGEEPSGIYRIHVCDFLILWSGNLLIVCFIKQE